MKIIKAQSKAAPLTKASVVVLKDYRPAKLKRHCNLCEAEFEPRSKFERYCEKCRHESELYHFAEWLSA